MTQNIFTYGTLRDSDVQKKLFNRVLNGSSDVLNNYVKYLITIDNESFYCIKQEEGMRVEGMVYQLSNDELLIADDYEGDEYVRINVALQSGLNSWVYVKPMDKTDKYVTINNVIEP